MHAPMMQAVLQLLPQREWSTKGMKSHACRYNEMRKEFEMVEPPEDSFILSTVSLIAQARPFLDVAYLHSIRPLSHNTTLKCTLISLDTWK